MTQKKTIAYELSIHAETPKTVTVGKSFKVTYHIRNEGNNIFPGGKIPIKISWAALGPFPYVFFSIEINKRLNSGEELSHTHEETPLASGYTLFTITKNDFPAVGQSGIVTLYLTDGRKLMPEMLFHAVRAKTFEETYTYLALIVSAISLAIIAFEKIIGFTYVVAPFLGGYPITIIMFVVYIVVLSSSMNKASLSKTFPISKIVLSGVSFGMLSYVLVLIFNSIELYFVPTKGKIHVIFVGPFQEEIVKFVFFLLASLFIHRLSLKRKSFYTNEDSKGLVLLGALIGLVFSVLENLIDYGYLNPTNTFLRTLTSWPLHMVTIGISAYGFYKFQTTRKINMLVALLSSAIIIHVVWNLCLLFPPSNTGL